MRLSRPGSAPVYTQTELEIDATLTTAAFDACGRESAAGRRRDDNLLNHEIYVTLFGVPDDGPAPTARGSNDGRRWKRIYAPLASAVATHSLTPPVRPSPNRFPEVEKK